VLFGSIGVVIMIAPVVIGFLMSLTGGNTLTFPPEGLSLRWYKALFDPIQSGRIHSSALNSLEIAMWATIFTAMFAVPAALGLARGRGRKFVFLEPLFLLPLVLPTIVYGIAALLFFTKMGIRTSKWLVVLGHTVVFAPLVYRTTVAVVSQLNPAFRESSENLGGRPLYTFRRITFPLILPGVIAGAFLVFMTSMDNVSVSLFLADARTHVLPIRMWQMIEESLDVRVAAISGVVIVVTFILLLIASRLTTIIPKQK
jgi:putative spermidine/putrescine transport system permease protein